MHPKWCFVIVCVFLLAAEILVAGETVATNRACTSFSLVELLGNTNAPPTPWHIKSGFALPTPPSLRVSDDGRLRDFERGQLVSTNGLKQTLEFVFTQAATEDARLLDLYIEHTGMSMAELIPVLRQITDVASTIRSDKPSVIRVRLLYTVSKLETNTVAQSQAGSLTAQQLKNLIAEQEKRKAEGNKGQVYFIDTEELRPAGGRHGTNSAGVHRP